MFNYKIFTKCQIRYLYYDSMIKNLRDNFKNLKNKVYKIKFLNYWQIKQLIHN